MYDNVVVNFFAFLQRVRVVSPNNNLLSRMIHNVFHVLVSFFQR